MNVAKFDIIARMFHAMTGFMAPGKHDPRGLDGHSIEERSFAFDKWRGENERILRAFDQAFDRTLGKE